MAPARYSPGGRAAGKWLSIETNSMKKLFALLACLALGALLIWAAENQTQFQKTVSSSSVPELLAPTGTTSAKSFIFIGVKAARTLNTSTVWLQMNNSTNDGIGAIPLSPGQVLTVPVDNIRPRIVDWYIDVETNGDGVGCKLIQ